MDRPARPGNFGPCRAGGDSTGVVWLRRDLRLCDHPALRAALEEHERVVPVFCFDDRLLRGRHASGPRTRPIGDRAEALERYRVG